MAEVMASAIVVPEEARDATPDINGHSNWLKRRQSGTDDQEQESKRQRKSPGKSSPAAHTTDASQEESMATSDTTKIATEQDGRDVRKRRGVADEKQRSKRLFGALLGNLNRPSDRNATKRAEIEQRRKAELKKQDDERLEDKQKRLEQLAIHRKREQIKVDEQNMHMRHKDMLSNANFLQTQSEPKLYYKPWELLPDEEDRIEDQIRDVEKQIDKELDEWDIEKRRKLNEIDGRTEDDETRNPSEGNGDAKKEDHQQADQLGNGDTKHEDKNEPADTGNPIKPGEVPESDLDPGESSQVQEPSEAERALSKDAVELLTDKVGATEGEAATEPQEEPKEEPNKDPKDEHDDEGDHIVEGDEDTVIY
ncbi:hypothetical protein DOTSEDRAFT_71432 [Dothistroma septosporum NZE10]|uniref:Pinin/SDK/MemA protein domain-containing protein n=1 Tax=Dothistroma septosporum (strain NZE10 / CBS 128990) TaxID=675120 RepID=N1PTJ8_DOTSN|nr:hypothetical protein DOTSEDRAFT_71432 [Dothistroma septosporum NZE10]